MNAGNKKASGQLAFKEWGAEIIESSTEDYNRKSPPLSTPPIRRRLSPQAGALLRLDSVEQRLQAARAAGDEIAFGRFYLSWCRLHSLAFSYGRFAKGASDE